METASKSASNLEQSEGRESTLVQRFKEGVRYQILKLIPSFERAEQIIAMGGRRADVVTSALHAIRAAVEQYQCSTKLGEGLIPGVLRFIENNRSFRIEYTPRKSHSESHPPCTSCSANDPSFRMCSGDPSIYGCDTAFASDVIDEEESLQVVPESRK